jgi:hypothetical protein
MINTLVVDLIEEDPRQHRRPQAAKPGRRARCPPLAAFSEGMRQEPWS